MLKLELELPCDFAWITSPVLSGSAFRYKTPGSDRFKTTVLLDDAFLKFNAPQTVVHVRISLLTVQQTDKDSPKIVRHVGGCVFGVGLPGTGKYFPSHVSVNDENFEFDFTPCLQRIPVYDLVPSSDESAQWESCSTQKLDEYVSVAIPSSWMIKTHDVTPQYTLRARSLVQKTRSTYSFNGMQAGFIRESEKRAGWSFCPLPGTLGLPEITSVGFSDAHLVGLLELSCGLTGFSGAKFMELYAKTDKSMIVDKESPVVNALLGLLGVFIGSGGWSVGYEAEIEDDTSSPGQKLGRQSDCEDFAIASVGLFSALISIHRRNARGNLLLYLLAKTADTYFSSAKMVTGFVDLVTARPDLKNVDSNSEKSGHGWCALITRSELPRKTLVQCGSISQPYALFVESTTPTVIHTGPQARDVTEAHENTPIESYNAEVVAAQELYNGILDLRLSPETSAVTDRNKEDGFQAAAFRSAHRYLTVAFEASNTVSSVICKNGTKTVGVSAKNYITGMFTKVSLQNRESAYIYRNVFAPLDLKEYNIDNPAYRSAEHTLLDRTADLKAKTISHGCGKAGVAFLFDKAPQALINAASRQVGYLADYDVPYIIALPTGDILMLPAV